jgi:hypothetical protein
VNALTKGARYPFSLPNRVIVVKGVQKGGVMTTFSLEEVKAQLEAMARVQNATDHERTLDQLHMDFSKGYMEARWLGPEGPEEPAFLLTTNAASQLASNVLPSRFFSGLKELAAMDSAGSKLATLNWMKFSSREGETPRVVRTVRMRIDGSDIRWVIRSCHSQEYALYSNIEFVDDILRHGGKWGHLPVLEWHLTDNGMRIRFAALDPGVAAFMHFDSSVVLSEPVPMIEAWNSETGCRRTGLRGGLFKLDTLMGLGHWNERTEYNWIHRGDPQRISNGVQNAFENLFVTASGVVEAYKEATNIAIDNAFTWMENELNGVVSEKTIKAVTGELTGPQVTPGGKLASVVDALAITARSETDIFDQYELERVASSLLNKGRGIALKNEGRIPVEGD